MGRKVVCSSAPPSAGPQSPNCPAVVRVLQWLLFLLPFYNLRWESTRHVTERALLEPPGSHRQETGRTPTQASRPARRQWRGSSGANWWQTWPAPPARGRGRAAARHGLRAPGLPCASHDEEISASARPGRGDPLSDPALCSGLPRCHPAPRSVPGHRGPWASGCRSAAVTLTRPQQEHLPPRAGPPLS